MTYNYTLKDIQKRAADFGYECLSEKYVDGNTVLHWKCSKGHEWHKNINGVGGKKIICSQCKLDDKWNKKMENLKAYAQSRGGHCLSEKYLGVFSKQEFECAEGHRWFTAGYGLLHVKTWCPICSISKKQTIEDMHALAAQYGGKYLTSDYFGSKHNAKWQCKEGHIWTSVPLRIKKGKWCPKCAGIMQGRPSSVTFETVRKLAVEKNVRLVSSEYLKYKSPLVWECNNGHQWTASLDKILRRKAWCQECPRTNSLSLEYYQEKAKELGGECLSSFCKSSTSILEFKCANGHVWKCKGEKIRQGFGCPQCYKDKRLQKKTDKLHALEQKRRNKKKAKAKKA